MCLIISADSYRYSRICNDLKNSTLLGTYNYPKTTTATNDIFFCYKKPTPPHQIHAPPAAVTFLQIDDTEKQDSPRKRWEIVSRSHILSLSVNMTLCGKLPIINSQHSYWITITTGRNHNEPDHK